MYCRMVWEGRDARVLARNVLGFADAGAWVARLEIWESDPDDPGAPLVEYRLLGAGRKQVIWRRW